MSRKDSDATDLSIPCNANAANLVSPCGGNFTGTPGAMAVVGQFGRGKGMVVVEVIRSRRIKLVLEVGVVVVEAVINETDGDILPSNV